MLMPSIFRENLLGNWMDDFSFPDMDRMFYGKPFADRMKTDVKENEESYEVAVEMPGIQKEDIRMQLQDGYLTITASRNENRDEQDESGRYVRRERYSGAMSRSFYVGGHVKEEDIHPKYTDGILSFTIPKEEKKKAVEESRFIAIEG